jgi:hypothetical protein
MKCDRCGSFMVEETYYHLGDKFTGLRCLLCGEVVDPAILENRAQIALFPNPLAGHNKILFGRKSRITL